MWVPHSIYEVSNVGKVRNVNRAFKRKGGKFVLGKDGKRVPTKSGGLLTRFEIKDGYGVNLFIDNAGGRKERKSIHQLVALAFLNNFEDKPWVLHWNGITSDNRLVNLAWSDTADRHKNKVLRREQGFGARVTNDAGWTLRQRAGLKRVGLPDRLVDQESLNTCIKKLSKLSMGSECL